MTIRESSLARLLGLREKFAHVGVDIDDFVSDGVLDREGLYDALMTTDSGRLRGLFGSSVKTEKGEKKGVATIVLYMAAAMMSGINLCAWASTGCAKACLGHTTGRLRMSTAQKAQLMKALAWHVSKACFLRQMDREIRAHIRKCEQEGYVPAVRCNGSSDVLWERYGVPQRHPAAQFYDYTKAPYRARRMVDSIPNYSLTFSVSERDRSIEEAVRYLRAGGNAAIVVAGERSDGKHLLRDAKRTAAEIVRSGFHGFPAIDGDETDIRFEDPAGHWVVLYAKGGVALRDTSGFVQRF